MAHFNEKVPPNWKEMSPEGRKEIVQALLDSPHYLCMMLTERMNVVCTCWEMHQDKICRC